MDLKEVNEKDASFQRAENAIRDERNRLKEKMLALDNAYQAFRREVEREGYEYTFSGWKKVKNR